MTVSVWEPRPMTRRLAGWYYRVLPGRRGHLGVDYRVFFRRRRGA